MIRLQLFEFEDYAWYPKVIREGQTDYLRFLMEFFGVFKGASPLIKELMDNSPHQNIIDFCSGGGGSMLMMYHLMYQQYGIKLQAQLSDLYPNLPAFETIAQQSDGCISYQKKPVNVLQSPPNEAGIYTIFNGFHHFTPQQAQNILNNFAQQNKSIGIFEPMDKSGLQLLINIVSTSLLLFLTMPFVRPFKWQNLVFTYLIPLIPIGTCWDGIASWFRLYDANRLQKMADQVPTKNYYWRSGVAAHTFGKVSYLIGYPKQ